MWFIWPRERTSMWSYLLLLHFKRTRNGRAWEKPTKNALRFNGMWNQPPPPKKSEKMCFFPLSKRASSIGKMVIHFVCSSLSTAQFRKKKTTNFPDSSDALLPQQDGRQHPHDGHGEQGSQDFRLVESWKMWRPPLAVSGHVWCVLWGFKPWREGKLMQDIRMQSQKFKEKNQ